MSVESNGNPDYDSIQESNYHEIYLKQLKQTITNSNFVLVQDVANIIADYLDETKYKIKYSHNHYTRNRKRAIDYVSIPLTKRSKRIANNYSSWFCKKILNATQNDC